MSRGRSLAVVGAGSTYTPLLVKSCSDKFQIDHVSFFDKEPQASKSAASSPLWDQCSAEFDWSENLDETLDGADAVIVSYRSGGLERRFELDALARSYGLLPQETHGICGLVSAIDNIRELIPMSEALARSSECQPVLLLTNPLGMVTAAATRLGINAIGLCEMPYGMTRSATELAGKLGLIDAGQEVEFRYLGLNHFGWLIDAITKPSGETILTDIAAIEHFETRYRPASIEESTAYIAAARWADLIANPYLGYLFFEDQVEPRATTALSLARETMDVIETGDSWLQYIQLIRRRGGYDLCGVLPEVVRSLTYGNELRTVLCYPNKDLTTKVGSPAAFETSGLLRDGRFLPDPMEVPAPIRSQLSWMAEYEVSVVDAALDGRVGALEEAVESNFLIRPKSKALAMLKDLNLVS